jgi:hypothetical protein
MRNEIWGFHLILWFTIMVYNIYPVDNMHPTSLYFADTQERFSPEFRPENECYRLIADNPVAGG